MIDFNLQYPDVQIKKDKYNTLDYYVKIDSNYLSRYNNTRIINEKETNYKIFETYDNAKIVTSDSDKYYKVTHLTENRLDIIAYKIYGNAMYWWILAMANDIIDPFNIPINTLLRIPPISSVYDIGSVLGTKLSIIAKKV